MRPWIPILSAVAALGHAVPVSAQEATAKETAVVLDFDGRAGTAVRNVVVRAVRGQLDLVPQRRVKAAARDRGADLGTARGRASVADAQGLDLLIDGRVEGRGKDLRVRVRVYGSDGRRAAARTTRVSVSARGRRAVGRAAKEAVTEALEAGAARTDPPRKAAPSQEPATEDDTEEPSEPEPSGLEEEEGGDGSAARPVPYVTVLGGVGGRARRAEVNLASGGVRRYESGLFLEVPVRLEVRPLAAHGRVAGGFSIRGDFAMAAALSSSEPGSANEVETTAYRVGVHAGYVYPFDWGGFGVRAGFVYETFDLGPNPVIPSSAYPLIRTGLVGRYDILGALLHVQLEAGFRYLFGLGELEEAFGAGADGMGFDVGLSVGGSHPVGFAYALRAGVEQSFLRFEGAASDAAAEDGTDRAFTLAALLGWGF